MKDASTFVDLSESSPNSTAWQAQPKQASTCAYCGGSPGRPIFEGVRDHMRFAPGEWFFWQCDDCGAACLKPMPSPEELAKYYPSVYTFAPEVGDPGVLKRFLSRLEYRVLYRPIYTADARRIARNTGGHPKGKRLLDVGCGRGLRLLALRELGYEVYGTDFQREVIEYLEGVLGIPARVADANDLQSAFGESCFDIIVAYHVVEHLPDPQAMARSCYRMLKPGGWFVAAVPLVDSVQASVFGARWYQVTEAPRHVALPSQKSLLQLARICGYEQAFLKVDSLRTCASVAAMTLCPSAMTNCVYGRKGVGTIGIRFLATLLAAGALPWCWLEGHVLRRPACGVVYMRKPGSLP